MKRLPLVLLIITIAALIFLMVYYGILFTGRTAARGEWEKRDVTLSRLDSKLRDLADKIQSVQGESRCISSNQCQIIGLGMKVCDYYKDYLIYSTVDADESNLLPWVAEFNRTQVKRQDLGLSANECGKKPGTVSCVGERCRLSFH